MRNLIFKTLFNLGAARYLRQAKKGSVSILSLHRITDEHDPFFLPLHPKAFDELLSYLKRHYSFVDFQDLPHLPALPAKPYMLLSFDDGYYDFVQYAMPILQKHGLRANHNIVNACANGSAYIWTERLNYLCQYCQLQEIPLSFESEGLELSLNGFGGNWVAFNIALFRRMLQLDRSVRMPILDRKEAEYGIRLERRMMNWNEVRQCASYGIEIGSHTYTHDVISTISDPAILNQELSDSRLEMEERLGQEVSIIALPNSEGTPHSDAAVNEAGFRYLLYVGDNTNKLSQAQGRDMKVLYRIGVPTEPLHESALRIELFHSKIRR